MSTAHTKGRLIVKGRYSVCTEDGETEVANTRWTTLDSSNDEDNARRLVACWNACEGVPTAWLEGRAAATRIDKLPIDYQIEALASQNAELLEALKGVLVWGTDENFSIASAWCEKARAAIAKAEGGEA